MKALFDTNILIDYLSGYKQALREIELYNDSFISIITKMELLVGTDNNNETIIQNFLDQFKTITIDNEIAELAIHIRRKEKIKLPDAIIWASAQSIGGLLITRNTKDFPVHRKDIKIPYQLTK